MSEHPGRYAEVLEGQEHRLRDRIRHYRRLRSAARRIDDAVASVAYAAFTADRDDDAVELTIGRLLVLLDQHDLFEEW
jgi:hypothetical protein